MQKSQKEHCVVVWCPPQPRTHSPLSSAEVLQSACSCLQGVVVLALRQQRKVEPDHFWLVQQLEACRGTQRGEHDGEKKGRSDELVSRL